MCLTVDSRKDPQCRKNEKKVPQAAHKYCLPQFDCWQKGISLGEARHIDLAGILLLNVAPRLTAK